MRWLPVRVEDSWLHDVWRNGAGRLAVDPAGEPAPSASGNVIGGPVICNGQRRWLRVAPFLENAMDEEWWTGTRDAAALTGVRKPALHDAVEWTHPDPVPVPVRAELLTLVDDPPLTPGGQFLDRTVELSATWLADLRVSLDALAGQSTSRRLWAHGAQRYGHLLHAVYGRPLPASAVPRWDSTEHLDLHWGNLTAPSLTILDWEHWGLGVAGYGAARLYCTALAVPAVAAQIYALFADLLDSPSGRYAQLVAAADILVNVAWYEDTVNLCPALHRLAAQILG